MTSIYERALGSDFGKLHPQIRRRFGFSSKNGIACIGRGVMRRLWRGPWWTLPFLWVGTWRRILFPEQGTEVPFTVENYAYRDGFGRETVTWVRTFGTQPVRRFDATMIWSEKRGRIVDYLGTHQHLAVDIDVSVEENGGLRLRSGEQRFYERWIGFRVPKWLTGDADVCEWWDEEAGVFRIKVEVKTRWGTGLFGYEGEFRVEWPRCEGVEVPEGVRPVREEARE